MDFMHDVLEDGRSYRLFNIIDDYNRQRLDITVDFTLPAQRIICSLEQLMEWRSKPKALLSMSVNNPLIMGGSSLQLAISHFRRLHLLFETEQGGDMDKERIFISLREDGYAVIPSLFSEEFISDTRKKILNHTHLFKKTRALNSSRHLASFHRHPRLEQLHSELACNEQIVQSLEAFFGDGVVTIGLSDITVNRSQQWHKDVLRGKYAKHLETIDIFNADAAAPIKALLYLQDSSSLKVVPGSHLHAADLKHGDETLAEEWSQAKAVSVKAGDLILMDIRLTHAGLDEADLSNQPRIEDNPDILVSTVFAKNQCPFARAMERGNLERLFDWQDRWEIYSVNESHHLEKAKSASVG